jgi:hypothetical protein
LLLPTPRLDKRDGATITARYTGDFLPWIFLLAAALSMNFTDRSCYYSKNCNSKCSSQILDYAVALRSYLILVISDIVCPSTAMPRSFTSLIRTGGRFRPHVTGFDLNSTIANG